MRNFKKVLSLVLCLAMMMSVMVVGAGAAFEDQDEIQNAEAVEMCTALGIIDGFEDGNYHPEKNITRAQAAKLICVMLNGGKDAVKDNANSTYTDVLTDSTSAWANKYIEFCSAEGIVAGVGDNRFAPASNLTGTQLAKMLLVSLGYDAAKEGFTGSAWALNVNTKAVKAGLYAGLEDVDMSAALSRDDAAQMIWNALNADTVIYLTSTTGAMTYGTPLLDSVFGAEVITGIMEGSIDYNYDTGVYTYAIGDKHNTYESDVDYGDLFAMNVKALVKGDDVLTMIVNKGGVVAEGALGDFDPSDYNFDNTPSFEPTVNVVEFNRYNETFGPRAYEDNATQQPFGLAPYYGYRAIDIDGGGDIDTIVVYPYTVMKVVDVDANDFSVRQLKSADAKLVASVDELGVAGRDIQFKKVDVIGDLEMGGYVIGIPAQNTLKHLNTYIDLDAQSGKVDKLNVKDTLMTIDGTEYNGSQLERIKAFEDISVGSTYTYVEVLGYLFLVDGAGVVKGDYAVVTDVAANTTGTTAKVWETDLLLSSGETITVNATAEADVGSMYTYSVNAAGNYVLTEVTGGSYEANTSIYDVQEAYSDYYFYDGANLSQETKSNWSLWNKTSTGANRYAEDANGNDYFLAGAESDSAKHYVNDDAVIFVYYADDNKYDVISGAELAAADVFGEACWAFTGANASGGYSYAELGYVALKHDINEVEYHAYVKSVDGRSYTEDGVTYYYTEVTVMLPGGEVKTVKTEASENQKNDLSKQAYRMETGKIYNVTLVGNEIVHIDLDEGGTPAALELTNAVVEAIGNNMLDLKIGDTVATYLIDADTEIFNLDSVDSLSRGDDVKVVVSDGTIDTLVYND